MSTAPHSNLTGGAQAPPSGVNGARPRALFNPANHRLDAAQRAARQNLATALELAEAGAFVFPVAPTKEPLVRWREASTRDEDEIVRLWSRFPGALVGLDCGKTGIFAVDADRHGDGPDGVATIEGIVGDIYALDCPIIMTAGGGRHFIFAQNPDDVLGNGEGAFKGRGVNCRGDGGYIIAVGSMKLDGSQYAADPNAPDMIERFVTGTLPFVPPEILTIIKARPCGRI